MVSEGIHDPSRLAVILNATIRGTKSLGNDCLREAALSIEPWQWPEETWRTMVGRARAGRNLKPAAWPDGARCAVAISFDADHETIPLRDNDPSPMRISHPSSRHFLRLMATDLQTVH